MTDPTEVRIRLIGLAVTLALSLHSPLAAHAEPTGKLWQIGLLVPGLPPGCGSDAHPAVLLALRGGLRELGHVERQNYVFVPLSALAAKEATESNPKPVVFASVADPVRLELVKSLASPGTNMTGIAGLTSELDVARLRLLNEVLGGGEGTRIGVLIAHEADPCPQGCRQPR